ncbi:hypothetical protein SAMN05443665_100855 [Actinomadura meyerae]|uniref:Uncharacterized protein n=1 Tax=Actinomadura meyerae TaxID=240840 RepID=A0A239GS72_9ACTN|nr:hypothetical protein [Actinomadura meyerae]SNS70924.1 hypothetical protein SAMN05443665_100855 [Actinomadura meyerae]
MDSTARTEPSDRHEPPDREPSGRGEPPAPVSRRGFLGRTAVAGSATVAAGAMLGGSGAGPSGQAVAAAGDPDAGAPAAQAAPLDQRREMLLQVARAGAVYPIEISGFGESARGADRVTAARLLAAERRLAPERLARARAGADALIAQGLLGVPQGRLLAGIGRHAAQAGEADQRNLRAFVALGVATVAPHFDPAEDAMAEVWLGGLARQHRLGQQPQPISSRN